MKAHYYPLRHDLLRNPALRAFMETPAGITCRFLMALATPRIQPLRSGTEIPELSEVFPRNDTELLVKTGAPLGIVLGHDLSGQGWLCAEMSAEYLHRRRPWRAVEQIQGDIELLAAMDFLEIHRVILNGTDTRVAKVGEWIVDKPSNSD